MSDHIPPIEMSPGSLYIQTWNRLSPPTRNSSDAYPRKQVFDGDGVIKRVRVILTDGTIKAGYNKDKLSAMGGKILIWVRRTSGHNSNNANLVIGTGDDGRLQIEIDNMKYEFAPDKSDCPTRHKKKRWKYSDPHRDTMLWRVRVLKPNGKTLADISTEPDLDQEIDRILIWTQ
jgi:hypothetical protein